MNPLEVVDLTNEVLLQGFELKDVKAEETAGDSLGQLEAVVSVFNNVDRYKERILPGAFKSSLSKKLPKGVWMHDWTQPIAKTVAARETPEGLYVKGLFNLETQRGREAYSDVKNGLVDEFSIGFRVQKWTHDKESGITDLVKLELFEWSPVLVGANPATRLVSVKNALGGDSLVGLRFEDHSEQVLALLKGYLDRVKRYVELRSVEGQSLNATRLSEFTQLRDALSELIDAPKPEDLTESLKSLRLQALKDEIYADGFAKL